ncbi:MAG: hypothetical protein KAR06_04945 [Deltaproteobacteria bacterium]|nr:hypothetical protein [Deltaproteobacteria bacterium]
MPGVTVGVYPGDQTAGTEVSSTYEGRHLTVREDELIHPFIADGFVNKGDPVVLCDAGVPATYGHAVGVAFNDGVATSDLIALDTEGIWNLTVYAEDDNGDRAIEIGDQLFIRAGTLPGAATGNGTGDAEISKISEATNAVPFGYALGSMVAGGSGVIAVKVHWDSGNIIVCHDLKAIEANERGSRQRGTVATPAMVDGYGVWESELTVTGLATGGIAGRSDWINLGGSATVPGYCFIHTDGIWDGGATLTTAYISWAKYQCLLSTNPAWCSIWELNFSGANSEIDSIFNVNNMALALGYAVGEAGQGVVGTIPFCSEAGGQIRYIDVHAASA